MPIQVPKRSAWIEFCNVISALLKREVATRFGKYQLGILWLLMEPLSNVIMMGVILGPIIGRTSGEIPFAFFMLCGFLQLKMFTTTMNSCMNAITANQGLLVFRQVEPIDTFVSRFLFSFLSIIFSFSVFCLIGFWVGIELSISNMGLLVSSLLITWLMGCGAGLILGIKVLQFKELEKIMQFINYPLIFMSCVFISFSSLPSKAQDILKWNPIVHTVELLRLSLFPDVYQVEGLNLRYPCVIAIIVLSLGFMYYRNNRHYLKQK